MTRPAGPTARRHGTVPAVQDPLAVGANDVLAALADDVLDGFGVSSALRRLLEDGFPGTPGIDELRRSLAALRRSTATGPAQRLLAQLAAELEAVIVLEREARASAGDDLGEVALDLLPLDAVTRFEALAGFDWSSPLARVRYEQVRTRVGREIVRVQYPVLRADVARAVDERLDDLIAVVGALRELVLAPGEHADLQLARLAARFPTVLFAVPPTVDELRFQMGARLAATSRLLASLPAEAAEQLRTLMDVVFEDPELQLELLQLEAALRERLPMLPWDVGDLGGGGGDSGSVLELVQRVEQLGALDELDHQLMRSGEQGLLIDVDEESLRATLGDDAVAAVRRLRGAEQALVRSGAVVHAGSELTLTSRGVRLIGALALRDLRRRARRTPGSPRLRPAPPASGPGEPSGSTRRWELGDEQPLNVAATVRNAVTRIAATGGRLDGRIRLQLDDLEVVETEEPEGVATVVLVDLSYSMQLQGHLVPAKRMALALGALVTDERPADSFQVIGFSDVARLLDADALAAAGYERVYGTNLHHGLQLARRHLQHDPRPVKRLLIVTDGEPTAHMVGGEARYAVQPTEETLTRTLQEARRLARAGVTVDILLLEEEPSLRSFAQELARVTGGTVARRDGDDVGRHAIAPYV